MVYTPTPSAVSGSAISSTAWNTGIRDNFADLGGPWQAYTPTVNWTLGNGTATGFTQSFGKTVRGRALVLIGSTTVATGVLNIGLPSQPIAGALWPIGRASLFDTSAANRFFRTVFNLSTPECIITTEADVRVNATTPFTWGAGDYAAIQFEYEVP